mgnify:FL=1
MTEQLKLTQIRLDGGTMTREVYPEVREDYKKFLGEGGIFPPIEVVFDGEDYWLWDGFHRWHAYDQSDPKKKIIEVNIRKGTLDEAIWLSFSANKSHGHRRLPKVLQNIIKNILNDKRWSKKTLTNIADHVGVSQQYVSKIKAGVVEKAEKGTTVVPFERAEEVEVKSSTGKTYEQRSQEKQTQPKAPLMDEVGKKVPQELAETYIGRQKIKDLIRDLENIKNKVEHCIEDKDPVFGLLCMPEFTMAYKDLHTTLKDAVPHCVCRYCGGDGKKCKSCKSTGMQSKAVYDRLPPEFKEAQQ